MSLREPDSEFVRWLRHFDPNLRVRFNPQRQRWVIDERNYETKLWQCILVWETDDGAYLDLNRDLALRLQLMRSKYQKLIVSPVDYVRDLERKSSLMHKQELQHVEDETFHQMMDDRKFLRAVMENSRRVKPI